MKIIYLSQGGYYRSKEDAENFKNPMSIKELDEFPDHMVKIYRCHKYCKAK